jgi:hypothetical protein
MWRPLGHDYAAGKLPIFPEFPSTARAEIYARGGLLVEKRWNGRPDAALLERSGRTAGGRIRRRWREPMTSCSRVKDEPCMSCGIERKAAPVRPAQGRIGGTGTATGARDADVDAADLHLLLARHWRGMIFMPVTGGHRQMLSAMR